MLLATAKELLICLTLPMRKASRDVFYTRGRIYRTIALLPIEWICTYLRALAIGQPPWTCTGEAISYLVLLPLVFNSTLAMSVECGGKTEEPFDAKYIAARLVITEIIAAASIILLRNIPDFDSRKLATFLVFCNAILVITPFYALCAERFVSPSNNNLPIFRSDEKGNADTSPR